MVIWTCTTDGDDMPVETVVCRTFEEAAEPCRIALSEMECDMPMQTADEIAEAWDATFGGVCIIKEHNLA